MPKKEINMKRGDLPQETLNSIVDAVKHYCVGIIGMKRGEYFDEPLFIGSGTLVKIDNKKVILTANHVLRNKYIANCYYLGLCHQGSGYQKIPIDFVTVLDIAKPNNNKEGPDLAALILGPEEIGWLEAQCSFYDLNKDGDVLDIVKKNINDGAWGLFGCPYEFIEKTIYQEKSHIDYLIKAQVGISGIPKIYKKNEFDFAEMSVVYDGIHDIPLSFEGVSGGGLWHLDLIINKEGIIEVSNPVLCGVAFYQTEIKNNERFVRCHFIGSVYEQAYSAILGKGN